ncbi:MAG: penicillin-binding protein 2 [Anaerolineales bacterium]|jgi:cell division protein FtsI/penicillin-binding protein 2
MNKDYSWRYSVLGALVSVLALLIIARMFTLQTSPVQVADLKKMNEMSSMRLEMIRPPRGQILDRWGHVLAGNKTVYEVGVELNQMKNPNTIATTLHLVLGIDEAKVLGLISQGKADGLSRVVIRSNVEENKAILLNQLRDQMAQEYAGKGKSAPSLSGLENIPFLARTYPEKEVASNLLGFVSKDGGIGYYGVEGKYNNLLAGKSENVWVPLDPNLAAQIPDTNTGADLVLTIDREVQASVEQELDSALKWSGSQAGTIVVLNPKNGEVIAMATTPRIDLNNYAQYMDRFNRDNPFDRAVSLTYEPGSVFKVLTMASALDNGSVKPDTTFIDTGVFEIGGTYIYNWNSGAWGPQDMTGCMQHSLNVCLAWVASQMGAKDFYRYMQAFGIGHLTGIDLAGEVTGRLKSPGDSDWYDADLGTNAFGQGVSVTPLQLAAAISAVANDGKEMTPHVVRSIISKGYQYDIQPTVMARPIKAKTAQTLSAMLATSLVGESSDALVPGYNLAGKTGTAEIPTPFGYTSNQTNASFVGWGPVDDPQFLVYIWLEKPTISPWGSEVAAPVFSKVVQKLVVLLNIPPDDVRHRLRGQ